MSKVVLGKGLEALIPGDGGAVAEDRQLREVPLNLIAPNPMQPRRHFDESSLAELAESFRRNGVMQPLVVQKTGSTFTIIAGERRFRAARMANLEQVPVVLMSDVDDSRMLELALVENLQREDLNPMETAEASRALIDSCGLTQAELAARLGKSRTAVTNLLRLLSLPDRIKQMIRQGSLTEGHARAILAVESEAEQLRLADSIINDSLSVREVERRAGHTRKKRRLVPKRKIPALAEAESWMRQTLGTSVKIHRGLKRGRIEIEYYSDDDLDRLLDLFRKITP